MALVFVDRVTELVTGSAELTDDRLGRADSKPQTRMELVEESSSRLRIGTCLQAGYWSVGRCDMFVWCASSCAMIVANAVDRLSDFKRENVLH